MAYYQYNDQWLDKKVPYTTSNYIILQWSIAIKQKDMHCQQGKNYQVILQIHLRVTEEINRDR